jgi:hypothetical protein
MSGSGYAAGYSEVDQRTTMGDLDPILVARGTDVHALLTSSKRRGVICLVTLISLLVLPDLIRTILLPEVEAVASRRTRFTNEKYGDHFLHLQEARVIEEVPQESIRHFSTYFSVPKDEVFDRSIFNGKALSQLFASPEPCNIPDIGRVIRQMEHTCASGQGFYAVAGDFRHWFHQLEMCEESRKWFGLAWVHGGIKHFARWCALPMGWSWSPTIAQACAWAVLCHHEPDEVEMTPFGTDKNLPNFVAVVYKGNTVGWMTVYYDNYLVVCTSCDATIEMDRRI